MIRKETKRTYMKGNNHENTNNYNYLAIQLQHSEKPNVSLSVAYQVYILIGSLTKNDIYCLPQVTPLGNSFAHHSVTLSYESITGSGNQTQQVE